MQHADQAVSDWQLGTVFGARARGCLKKTLPGKGLPGVTLRQANLSVKTGAGNDGAPKRKSLVSSGIAGGMTGLVIRNRYLRRQPHSLSPRYAATSGQIADPATHLKASQ